jgi:hypothetical protein
MLAEGVGPSTIPVFGQPLALEHNPSFAIGSQRTPFPKLDALSIMTYAWDRILKVVS